MDEILGTHRCLRALAVREFGRCCQERQRLNPELARLEAGGFADLKELLAGPPSPEREEMRVWAGEDYDPAHFDLAAANTAAGSI